MFGECISYRARYQPDTSAIETPQGPITYRRFDADINRMARHLGGLGLTPRSRVLVSDSRPYIHWLVVFALERLGHVSVSDDVAGATLGVVPCEAIFSEAGTYADRAALVVQTTPEWLGPVLGGPEVAPPTIERRSEDPVRIITSSGTTGRPKALLFNRLQMDNRVLHVTAIQLPTQARMLSTMGLNSGGGFSIPLSVWLGGGTMLYGGGLTSAQAILQLRPTFVFMAPIQLQYALMQLPAAIPRMPDMWIALGGSAAPRRLCAEAERRLTSNLVFGYGSTEAGLTAIGPAMLVNEQPGAAGYRVPWAEMQIVDEDHNELRPGEIGAVRVKTDEMTDGYLNGNSASGEGAFRDGWFYPGDMGSIRADGLFVIEGRTDDVLNLGGVKVSAWTVEERLLEDSRVREAAAFALPDAQGVPELVAAVVGTTEAQGVAGSFAERFKRAIRIVPVERIPRNPAGKILRADLIVEIASAAGR